MSYDRRPALPPELAAALARGAAPGGGTMNLTIHARYDLRKAMADAVALASQVRAQLVSTAAALHKTADEVDGSLHVIRANTLGKLPTGLDARMVPSADDVRDLRQLADAVARLAEFSSEVALLDPFDDPTLKAELKAE